jgi:CRP-like cAMP-binding protein
MAGTDYTGLSSGFGDRLSQFAFLKSHGHRELHSKGELIVCEGEPGDAMYVIEAGVVEVTADDVLLSTLERGDIIGEMSLIDDAPRSATVRALTDCALVRIDRDRFMELGESSLEFFRFMMAVMSERLRQSNSLIVTLTKGERGR